MAEAESLRSAGIQQDGHSVRGMAADYTALQFPILLGSLAVVILPFRLPLYAQRLGASAVGIGWASGPVLLQRARPASQPRVGSAVVARQAPARRSA